MGGTFLAGGIWLSTGAMVGIFIVLVLLVVLLIVAMSIVARERNGKSTAGLTGATAGGAAAGTEVAAAIALALEMDRASAVSSMPVRAMRTGSAWNAKSYGMTRMPERRKR